MSDKHNKGPLTGWVIMLCVLSVMTLSYRQIFFAYASLGPELLTHGVTSDDMAMWTIYGTGTISESGEGTLFQQPTTGGAYRVIQTVSLADPSTYYRMDVSLGPVEVSAIGSERWQVPRLLAYSFNAAQGPQWHLPHTLQMFPKSHHDTSAHYVIIKPLADHDRISFEINFTAAAGVMTISSVSLRAYEHAGRLTFARNTLMITWIVFGALIVLRLWRQGTFNALLILICVAPIITLFLLPSAAVSYAVLSLSPTLSNHMDFVGWLSHSIVFVMIGAYLRLLFVNQKLSVTIIFICALALGSEAIQQFVESRDPSLEDIIFDLAGGLLGLYAMHGLMIWDKRRHVANRH